MRILIVGVFSWDHQEPSFCRGLRAAGADVRELRVGGPWRQFDPVRRFQMKYLVGPQVASLNARFLATIARARPSVVLAWRTSWLWPRTIEAARGLGARVVLYNNDDPFGPDGATRLWTRFRALVPHADACFAYRDVNVDDYRRAGARRVFLMRSWYSSEIHRPVALTDDDRLRFDADATFIGHYEDDGRFEALQLLRAAGLKVRVYGGGWDTAGPNVRAALGVPQPLFAKEYARSIQAARVGLVFLSRRNRDQYTRRCFEIPAIGTLMVAPRTRELASMYTEDVEAVYFGSHDELVAKALACVADAGLRERIARAGQARCLRDGHDAVARARQFLRDLETL